MSGNGQSPYLVNDYLDDPFKDTTYWQRFSKRNLKPIRQLPPGKPGEIHPEVLDQYKTDIANEQWRRTVTQSTLGLWGSTVLGFGVFKMMPGNDKSWGLNPAAPGAAPTPTSSTSATVSGNLAAATARKNGARFNDGVQPDWSKTLPDGTTTTPTPGTAGQLPAHTGTGYGGLTQEELAQLGQAKPPEDPLQTRFGTTLHTTTARPPRFNP
jgi:hypothetical protein